MKPTPRPHGHLGQRRADAAGPTSWTPLEQAAGHQGAHGLGHRQVHGHVEGRAADPPRWPRARAHAEPLSSGWVTPTSTSRPPSTSADAGRAAIEPVDQPRACR